MCTKCTYVCVELPELIPAVLWTRKDIREFKDSLRKNSENIIRVSSLSIATVSSRYTNSTTTTITTASGIALVSNKQLLYIKPG